MHTMYDLQQRDNMANNPFITSVKKILQFQSNNPTTLSQDEFTQQINTDNTVTLPAQSCLKHIHGIEKNLSEALLKHSTLIECDFSRAFLDEAQLTGSTLIAVDLGGPGSAEALNAQQTTLQGVNFNFVNLNEADFSNASLNFVNFIGANLINVDFSNAQFGKGVLMIAANLSPNTELPTGVIRTADQLRQQLTEHVFSSQEIEHIQEQLELAQQALSSGLDLAIGYKPSSHLAHVQAALTAISSHQPTPSRPASP